MKAKTKNKFKVIFLIFAGVVIVIAFSKILEFFYALFFSWIF